MQCEEQASTASIKAKVDRRKSARHGKQEQDEEEDEDDEGQQPPQDDDDADFPSDDVFDAATCIPEENGGRSVTDTTEEAITDWDGDPVKQSEFARSWVNQKIQKEHRSKEDFVLLTGNANIPLAKKIAKHLGVGRSSIIRSNRNLVGCHLSVKNPPVTHFPSEVSPMRLSRFRDGETKLQIVNSCRGKDIFIVQPTQPPVSASFDFR